MRISDNGIDRDMTEQENAEYRSAAKVMQSESKARQAAAEAKAALRESALAKLGLTADEISALFG